MPLKKVKRGKQTCWKWGDKGKVYCGPGAKKKALRQGRAIKSQSTEYTSLIEKVKKYLEGK